MVGNTNPAISDQRKHALEALQRRFDSANAELLQQQQNQQEASIKQSNREAEEKGEGKRKVSSLSTTAPAFETDKSGRSSLTPLSKKGNFAVSGHTPSRGTPGGSGFVAIYNCLWRRCKVTASVNELLYKSASSSDKTFKLYPGMWHALTFGEPIENIGIVFKDITEWLEKRTDRSWQLTVRTETKRQ